MNWNKTNDRCISDEMIQMYIDKELDESDKTIIERHLEACEDCRQRFQEHEKLISNFKEELSLVDKRSIKIPEFKPKKDRIITIRKVKLSYWKWTAAVLLITTSLFIYKQVNTRSDQNVQYIFYDMDSEIDANKPWHEQSVSLYIIDESGNIVE